MSNRERERKIVRGEIINNMKISKKKLRNIIKEEMSTIDMMFEVTASDAIKVAKDSALNKLRDEIGEFRDPIKQAIADYIRDNSREIAQKITPNLPIIKGEGPRVEIFLKNKADPIADCIVDMLWVT